VSIPIVLGGVFLVLAAAYGITRWQLFDELSRGPKDPNLLYPESFETSAFRKLGRLRQQTLFDRGDEPRFRQLQRRARVVRVLALISAGALLIAESTH